MIAGLMGPGRATGVALALAILSGCASRGTTPRQPQAAAVEARPPAPESRTAPKRAREQPPRRATIHFEELAGKPFPYPLVRARVRGVQTWLILDTGASHTVLDVWLLEQLGVRLVASDQAGEGHSGEKVATMRALQPRLELEGWGPVPGEDLLAVRLPRLFRNLGLGGVISPQSLAEAGMAVVVDLPASSLTLVSDEEAARGGADGSLGLAEACEVGGEPVGVVYLVEAKIQGEPVRLVVDSGAARSDVLSGSRAGRRLRSGATRGDASYTVAGRVEGRRLVGASVSVGRVARALDVAILPGVPTGACPRDGHLGLDVLRDCVLWLAPGHFGARCRPR